MGLRFRIQGLGFRGSQGGVVRVMQNVNHGYRDPLPHSSLSSSHALAKHDKPSRRNILDLGLGFRYVYYAVWAYQSRRLVVSGPPVRRIRAAVWGRHNRYAPGLSIQSRGPQTMVERPSKNIPKVENNASPTSKP